MIDLERQSIVHLDRTILDLDPMSENPAGLLGGIEHENPRAILALHDAGIADLAAALAIERGLVEDDETLFAGIECIDARAIPDQRHDRAVALFGFVAEKFGRPCPVGHSEPDCARRRIART